VAVPVDFPPFVPRAPWLTPDLQTVRNALRRPEPRFDGFAPERLVLPLSDGSGDALAALLQRAEGGPPRPLAVLVHGLGGSEESAYLKVSAAHLLARGHAVLRLNLRGAGPSRPLCRLQYHAGRTGDLRDALTALPPDLRSEGLVLVGFSLGGNLVLKLLGESGPEWPIRAAASVSAPIDLAAASHRFLEPRNRFYQWNLLRALKREALSGAVLDAEERRAVREARSVYEFDDRFVAPRNGWASAEAYYRAAASRRFLPEIRVPTLVVHALDDPWIPGEAYTSFPWAGNRHLVPLLPGQGGHVGFHGRDRRRPWHDTCLARFLDGLGL
jgi:predicted alpha/beta-fold hydrolase